MTRIFVTLIFKAVDEILWCHHSLQKLFHCAIGLIFLWLLSLFVICFVVCEKLRVFHHVLKQLFCFTLPTSCSHYLLQKQQYLDYH